MYLKNGIGNGHCRRWAVVHGSHAKAHVQVAPEVRPGDAGRKDDSNRLHHGTIWRKLPFRTILTEFHIMKINTEVLIVGAGPTGLTLAVDLQRRGIAVRIIDKAPRPFRGSKGKGLQPRSLEVMDDLGIVDQIIANGQFHLAFKAWQGNTELGVRDMSEGLVPTPAAPYGSVLITPQWRVEEALRQALERGGTYVEMGVELTGFVQKEDAVHARLRLPDGSESLLTCNYMLACDGGRSLIRKTLAVPFEGETWKTEKMYVADVHIRGLDREFWHVWPTDPAKSVMLCPLPSTDEYQLQLPVSGEEDVPEPSLDLLRQIVAERTGDANIELLDATWMSLYRVNVRLVSHYRVERIMLAGDAAHVHTPAGGQGMNTGIQDAYNLGWKLAAVLRGTPDALLDTYCLERLPVAANVLGISTRLYQSMRKGTTAEERNKVDTRQLAIGYRSSPLSMDAAVPGLKVAAGDRAPDAPGTAADGSSLHLFDLFRGAHWTALLLGEGRAPNVPEGIQLISVTPKGNTASIKAGRVLVDTEGHVAEAYGWQDGTIVLIRPDGYIALVSLDPRDLRAWWKEWLGEA
jgi:2-polyprenyl-6-methoxyphenol hydroxylase-like FAD-dependent oxidoreductase